MADDDLMRRALARAGKAVPPPAKSRSEVRAEQGVLLPRERAFVRAYLETGVAARAAEAAGYRSPRTSGRKVLLRPVVAEAIRRAVAASEAGEILSKIDVLVEAQKVLREGRPFERLKALELVSRLQGYMAPAKSVHEHRAVGVSQYEELVQTLRESGAHFNRQEREALRAQLVADAAQIQEALAILDGRTATTGH